jgi:spermine oxidase
LERAIHNGKLTDETVDYACDSFDNISAVGFFTYERFGGEQYTNLRNGYIRLINHLSSGISKSSIKLNSDVLSVDWQRKDNRVLIRLSNQPIAYRARYVISTTSLGYLKQYHRRFFVPALPLAKQRSIERLGFGTINKLFLFFDKPIFTKGERGFQVFWTGDMPNMNITRNSDFNRSPNIRRIMRGFSSFYVFPKAPNMIFAFLVGTAAEFSEHMSDSDLQTLMFHVLKNSFPKFKFQNPTGFERFFLIEKFRLFK